MSYFTRIGSLFRQPALEREFDEEILFHLQARTAQNRERGMTAEAAEAEARRRFGSVDGAKAGMRQARIAKPLALVLPALAILTLSMSGVLWSRREPVYDLTAGISAPVPIAAPRAEYTTEAMRQKIQGTIRLQCVVGRDGVCSDVKVIRSLDRTFGLDDRAVTTLREWRFRPGLRQGRSVATRITFELRFALR
jgi:TonB family protein